MGRIHVFFWFIVFSMPVVFARAQGPVIEAADLIVQPVAVESSGEQEATEAVVSSQGCCSQCRKVRCCCPGWLVTPEVMFLRRRNSSPTTLVTNQVTGAPLLTTRDFDDDYDAIPRLQIIRQDCCCDGWEVNMFGLTSLETTDFSGDPESPLYHAPGLPIGSTAPGTVFRTDYETQLHSLEFNHRRFQNQCLTWVAGFRWMELSDNLTVSQVAPVQRDLFSIDTNNHMYGFQVGFDAILWNNRRRFRVESSLRTAVLHNSADMTMDAPLFGAAQVGGISARDDHTAFFAELGIDAVYQMTNRLAIRGGYQFMWLEGVALAPDQIAANSLFGGGPAAVDTSGSLYLSGFTLGATLRF